MSQGKPRVLLVSIVPPHNDCGVRIVMHRHLVERSPFELHLASNADSVGDPLVHTRLRLPYLIHRLRKSRFGPRLTAWVTDYGNFIWPLATNAALEAAVEDFKPDVVLTLAECGLCHVAQKTAQRHGLPLVGLFFDWFPVMKGHYGHKSTQSILSRRYRELYAACDLAFCSSDGMQEMLGPHPNSHVIYPMPGRHRVPERAWPSRSGKFRDLGFKPPEEAAEVLASADALLSVMSFEKEHELFMRTSFTTKFLDYVSFGKPVILWGPEYCTPVRVAREHGGAAVVSAADATAVVCLCRKIARDTELNEKLSKQALQLHQTLFNPDRLQDIFVQKITQLING